MSSDTTLSPPSEPVIVVQGAGKNYRMYGTPSDRLWQYLWPSRKPWFQNFTALEDVSLELRRGEVLGIVGVNGAGKSTLLQLVTGTIPPTSGSVQTHGRVAAILELGSGFNPEFTGRENIYLNAATLGLGKSEIESRINSIIDFAGIGLHIDQPVKTYSSGMVVRLAFSIATSVDADILIIDEALSVGDGAFRRRSFDRIMQIKESGTTILFCSHVLFHVEAFCDRALWLHRGKVQKLGKVSEVLRPYEEFIDAYEKDVNALPFAPTEAPHSNGLMSVESAMTDASASASPKGDARIVSVAVRLDGELGVDLHGLSHRSRLEVEVGFLSDPSLPAPSSALVFSSDSGKILGSSISCTDGAVFERNAFGEGMARFTIERVPLNKGKYRVGVYLFCEKGLHGYAMLDPVAHIHLTHTGHEQGAFLISGTWDNGPPRLDGHVE
jgi:lipopolysaccharide transport system ATP-binding protein